MTARKLFMLILPVLLLVAAACTANAEEAENLTPRCTVKLASKGRQASKITDGDYRSYWESVKAKQPWVTVSSPEPIYGLYLCFEHMPESYVVEQASGSGWVTASEGDTRFHHVFYELDGAKKIRIRSTAEGKTQIGFNEIFAFGAGEIPDWVTHIGYRAHYFEPVWGERRDNCIEFNLARIDDLPFEKNYYVYPESTAETSVHADDNLLCWFVQGEEQREVEERGLPDYLRLNEDNILMLE